MRERVIVFALRLFSRNSKLNLDRANAACMGHAPPTFNHVTVFSPPIVANFCVHLFMKYVSFNVAVLGAFGVSFRFAS